MFVAELRLRNDRIRRLEADLAASRRTPAMVADVLANAETTARAKLADLRTALTADLPDMRDVLQSLLPDGLIFRPATNTPRRVWAISGTARRGASASAHAYTPDSDDGRCLVIDVDDQYAPNRRLRYIPDKPTISNLSCGHGQGAGLPRRGCSSLRDLNRLRLRQVRHRRWCAGSSQPGDQPIVEVRHGLVQCGGAPVGGLPFTNRSSNTIPVTVPV